MNCKIPGCRGTISEDKGVIFPGAKTYARPCKKCTVMHGENGEPLIAKIEVDGVPLEAYIYWGQHGVNFDMFTRAEVAELQAKTKEG